MAPAVLSLLAAPSGAQQLDPLLGYVLSANGGSWALGGELDEIRPIQLTPPIGGSDSPRWGFSLSGIYFDYFRKGGLEGREALFRRNVGGSAFARGKGKTAWDAGISSGERRWQVGLVEDRHDLELDAACSNWVTSIESRVALKSFVLAAGLATSPGNPLEPTFAAGADLKQYGAFGAIWTRRQLCPDVDVSWKGEHGHITLDGRRQGFTGWMRSPQLGPLRAEVILRSIQWLSMSGLSLDTTLEPTGDESAYHGFLSVHSNRWGGAVGIRGMDLDLMAYGMKGEFDYAKVTACRLATKGIFASADYHRPGSGHRFLAEVERLEWEGYGRGHLEFWPFTEGFVDLLGLRRYFVARTEGRIWRLHLGGAGPVAERWQYAAGINLMDVQPSADLRHWRPAFIVFGVADEKSHRIDVREILAGVVSLTAKYRMKRWEMEYSLSQIVPLSVKRYAGSDAQEPPAGSAESGGDPRGYGGGFHRVNLRLYF
jgi:hypothetical protein